MRAAQTTLDEHGFTQVDVPLLSTLSGACGEPGTLIPVQVNGRQAYLSQTAQLHLETLMRELGQVYSISRSFRDERHATDRHLTEFTLVEGEADGWSLEDIIVLVERTVTNMLATAASTAGPSLSALGADPDRIAAAKARFPRMTYDEAIITLQKAGHFVEWGEEFSHTDELALARIAGGPVFVTHFPVAHRFFTMKVSRNDPRVVECCDLLMPDVGEVLGGSETETDPDLLRQKFTASRGVRQVLELGGTIDAYTWYLDMHRQGSTQQAGFGMGFERIVRYACGFKSIAEAVI